jgi:hypothetical protein
VFRCRCGSLQQKTARRRQKVNMTLMYGAPDLKKGDDQVAGSQEGLVIEGLDFEGLDSEGLDSEGLEEEADMEGALSSPAGGWPETQGALDAPSSPPYSGPASSPARDEAASTTNTGRALWPGTVAPIFASTLRFLTKQFKTPFNLQYLGTGPNNSLMFSDGVHVLPASVGPSYKYLLTSGIIKHMSIVTIIIATRERKAPFNLKFTNLQIAPKHTQTYQQCGKPIPY